MNSLKRGSFKLFSGSSSDDKDKFKGGKTMGSLSKATSMTLPHHGHLTTILTKSSSFGAYPDKGGSKTLQMPSKACRTLRRRESLDFSDILHKHDKSIDDSVLPSSSNKFKTLNNRRPSEQMRMRFKRSRTLPCISSWDMYGDDSIQVTFGNLRASSFSNLKAKFALKQAEEAKAPREKIKKEDAIYEVVGDKLPVIAGTKEKLFKLLIDPHAEPEYLHQFIETHIWHTPSGDLFNKLVDMYNPNLASSDVNLTRLRVIGIIIHWLDFYPYDFDSEMKNRLIAFIDIVSKTGMPAKDLLDAVAGNRRSSHDLTPISATPNKPSKIPKKSTGESGKFQFLDFHPTEVARQFSLMEHGKLMEINRTEFLRQAWNKSDGETRSPKLVAYIKKFNQVSYWVATEIVFTPNLKQRISVVKKMIQTANKCVSFNNFNTAMEIVAGLNLSSVQRLKKTWKGLPSKYAGVLEDLTKLLASEANYRHYRTVLQNAEGAVCPYLGVFLRDLTFIEDGNTDFVEDDQFLNFDKLRMISNVLSSIAKYQRVKYTFEVVPAIRDYLQDAMFLDDAALYKYSQLCETSTGNTAMNSGMSTSTGVITKKRTSLGVFN